MSNPSVRDKALAAVRAKLPHAGHFIHPDGMIVEYLETAYEAGVAAERERCQAYADALRHGDLDDARDVCQGIASGYGLEGDEP